MKYIALVSIFLLGSAAIAQENLSDPNYWQRLDGDTRSYESQDNEEEADETTRRYDHWIRMNYGWWWDATISNPSSPEAAQSRKPVKRSFKAGELTICKYDTFMHIKSKSSGFQMHINYPMANLINAVNIPGTSIQLHILPEGQWSAVNEKHEDLFQEIECH